MISRIERLTKQLRSVRYEVCPERAILVTESYRDTEGEPILIRRAKALKRVLEEQSIAIYDDELIVGIQGGKKGAVPLFPEFAIDWLEEEILYGKSEEMKEGTQFVISEKTKEELQKIVPYWKGKTLQDRIFKALPQPVKIARDASLFNLTMHEDSGLGHILPNFPKVLKEGFVGIRKEAAEKLEQLNLSDPENFKKSLFWKAVIIFCEATIKFAKRYAEEAKRLEAKEVNSLRKVELKKIAEVCEQVPAKPARNFYEALQSCWFVQLLLQIETNGSSVSLGRLDQYLYSFYKKDIENSVITQAEAQELLECFFLKLSEVVKVRPRTRRTLHGGFTRFQNLTLGGQTKEGEDATNKLTFMCLNAREHLKLVDPQLSLRVHARSPDNLLLKAAKLIRQGGGHPALFSDEVIIPSLVNRGVPLSIARDYAIVGCVEISFIGLFSRADGGYVNMPKALELALNNGIDRATKKQVGLLTGDPVRFSSFDDVLEAFKKQLEYIIHLQTIENNLIDMTHEEILPHVFMSCVVPDCVEKGKDVTAGGGRFNWTSPMAVGLANVGNSLAAVKRLVFDDKKVAMTGLIEALDVNFKGEEDLRQMLLNAPKYGNDNDYVDSITKKVVHIYYNAIEKQRNHRGGIFVPSMYSLTSNVPLGWATGALPDGRKAKEPFAEGISPTQGTDTEGPTASLKSVGKMDLVRASGGIILNQKFNPDLLQNEKDLKSFIDLFKTYLISLGGMEVQYNVVSKDALIEAQKHPEKYRNLIVRVTGYSAFFVDVSKAIQDDIIKRTEYISFA